MTKLFSMVISTPRAKPYESERDQRKGNLREDPGQSGELISRPLNGQRSLSLYAPNFRRFFVLQISEGNCTTY